MPKLKRLATHNDLLAAVTIPVCEAEVEDRRDHYSLLTPEQFATMYRKSLFTPVTINVDGDDYAIQVNQCVDPFCKWFGLGQERYPDIKSKPSRYRISSGLVLCNDDPLGSPGITTGTYATAYSNWGVAEEIVRLHVNDRVVDWEPDYVFHSEECSNPEATPFKQPEVFKKKGKRQGNGGSVGSVGSNVTFS